MGFPTRPGVGRIKGGERWMNGEDDTGAPDDAASGSPPSRPGGMDGLPDWIVRQATASDAADELLDTVCRTLLAGGVPLWRVSIGTAALDPMFRGLGLNWWPDRPLETVNVAHGPESDASFARSPVNALVMAKKTAARWRLMHGEGCETYPMLEELREGGATDYLLRVVPFAEGSGLKGVWVSLATDRSWGFSDADAAVVDRLLPAFALSVFRLSTSRTMREVLKTYLGPLSSRRVLAGDTRRGLGHSIAAAILLADLRGFTGMAEREDPAHVVAWLNEHLEAAGEPVALHGGEILKFMGDGLLAVFPVEDRDSRPCLVCGRALEAAQAAIANNAAVNEARRAAGLPALDLDVALHFGDVFYGNVGSGRRLDFTIIGRAVNEASRIEALCETLGRPLLCSAAFAERCGRPMANLGAFAMRGVAGSRTIWGV